MTNRVKILKQKFSQSWGLPFRELLPESVIEQAIDELKIKYRRRLFDPFVTIWVFLSQVLDVDKSCHNATSRVIAYLVSEGVEIPSTDTSAYCQARARLPEELLQKLFGKVAQDLEEKVTAEDLWCGRHLKVIDGSTVSMPDTVENQKAYPQPKSQKPGCGFPIAKIGMIFSLTTGAAIALVIDVLNTHDLKLARKLYQFLNPFDVILGDRAFCAYADLVTIKNLDCDAVFRKHQSRKTPMYRGRIVGESDKLVTWHKPKRCPQGLSEDAFAALPSTLVVREIYYYIIIPGFRTTSVSLITTLLDTKIYPTLELVRLYDLRWDVEVDLKHLKSTLGMDVLRCKTPLMVRKELYVYLLAYNLLRTLMWLSGTTYGVPPLRLSLQGTRQHLNHFIPQMLANSGVKRHHIYQTLLTIIVHKPVPHRPGRAEPRVRKRRPKAYPLMNQPRNQLRQQLQAA
ncbi:IS4 family transposase [Chroococcidiopsis sp. CCNUC1]|uniref:IS4 family transposase n=1 Tax=Chroococcidiopsis sp. CCNUC1 TaxID=2653189 RepID=UPI0020204247|nr:IS4 family transposase [Chroococcidiopsis sp. CCNUC1]URD53607.1 IS4 family transposase [Chroococcidiopsis sp. CCNUC1]URD53632.1 IS4 family transposase [Chroococcidiopsis sp. CCNUC1]